MFVEFVQYFCNRVHWLITSGELAPVRSPSGNIALSFLMLSAGIFAPVYYTVIKEVLVLANPINYKLVRIRKRHDN